MILITDNGQLDLPADFSFEMVQNSPVFSHEGTQSIPTTLPASPRNIETLGYPTRIARNDKYIRKLSAKLYSSIYQKDGQFVIDTAAKKAGIVGAIMLNESDLYSKIKDVKLVEIFGKIIRDDYNASGTPVQSWYNHIFSCMTEEINDDFTAFPVAVNYNEESGYKLLNGPDLTSQSDPWALRWAAREIIQDSETIDVPDGYGIAPFLWLYRVIELIFAEYGYTVTANPFKDIALLKKIVLINNTADTICPGKINYSDLVPTCTVSEFILFLETKFFTHAYITPELKTVDLISMQSILSAPADMDLSARINGEIKQIFSDTKEVDISSDTSLEGANPAMSSIFELAKTYETFINVNETEWLNHTFWQNLVTKRSLVFRKATGEYYDMFYRSIYQRERTPPNSFTRLGTNYFRFFTNKTTAQEYKSNDLMPTIVELNLGTWNTKAAKLVCPFIGESRLRNISREGKDSEAEQKIIIAYAAGKAESNTAIAANYYQGTTQKFNNLGNTWCDSDLTTTDIYKLFFKKWNDVLRTSGTEIECRVDYTDEQLFSLKLQRLKMINGQLLLQKSLSYNVSKKITHNTSKFLFVKGISPGIDDEIPFLI